MKKIVCLVLVIFVLFVGIVLPAQARDRGGQESPRGSLTPLPVQGGDRGHDYDHDHGHSSFQGSFWVGPEWGPWWWGPAAYPYYYDYYWAPPVVIERQPPVYVEPAQQPEEQYYWYYCPDARNYYPYVKKCPKGWLKVVPDTAPSDYKE